MMTGEYKFIGNNFGMKKLFFSGGNGFIGKNFKEAYEPDFNIDSPIRAQLELTDSKAVDQYFLQNKFDFIIHGANVGGTRKSNPLPFECLNANMLAFSNIFKHQQSIQRFIQLGSGAEYGKNRAISKVNESHLEKNIPQDEYGLSKLYCSKILNSLPTSRAVTLHLFGVFGKYEDYQMRFISNAIVRAIFELPIIINQNVKFDYLYVKDCIKIIHEFIQKPSQFHHYNVGSGQVVQLTEIAEMVIEIVGNKNDIIVKNKDLGNEYTCNIDRLKDFLGCNFAFTSLYSAIKELSEWYKNNSESLNREWILNPR